MFESKAQPVGPKPKSDPRDWAIKTDGAVNSDFNRQQIFIECRK
jgi:hypothetical protein